MNWLDFLAGTILAVVFVIFFAVLWFAIRDLRNEEPVVYVDPSRDAKGSVRLGKNYILDDRLDRDFQLIEFMHALRKDAS